MTAIEISDELAAMLKTKAAAQGLTLGTWWKKLVAESAAPESEQDEKAKLEWLRAAANEGFSAIDHADYAELISDEEVTGFLRQIHQEVKTELRPERSAR